MHLVYGADELIAAFVAFHIPRVARYGFPKAARAIGVCDDAGGILGGMVYSNWDPDSGVIELSVAAISKRWWNRQVLFGLFKYPFIDLDCQMVVSRVSERDHALCRMKVAFGFEPHLIPRLYGRDESAFIFTLTREAWLGNRFNKGLRHGQAFRPEAA